MNAVAGRQVSCVQHHPVGGKAQAVHGLCMGCVRMPALLLAASMRTHMPVHVRMYACVHVQRGVCREGCASHHARKAGWAVCEGRFSQGRVPPAKHSATQRAASSQHWSPCPWRAQLKPHLGRNKQGNPLLWGAKDTVVAGLHKHAAEARWPSRSHAGTLPVPPCASPSTTHTPHPPPLRPSARRLPMCAWDVLQTAWGQEPLMVPLVLGLGPHVCFASCCLHACGTADMWLCSRTASASGGCLGLQGALSTWCCSLCSLCQAHLQPGHVCARL